MRPSSPAILLTTLTLAALAAGCIDGAEDDRGTAARWRFATVGIGKRNGNGREATVLKGLAVALGDPGGEATICYDLDLGRVAAGWTGGFATPPTLTSSPEAIGLLAFTCPTLAGFQAGVLRPRRPTEEGADRRGGLAAGETDILKAEIAELKRLLHERPSPSLERLLAAHEQLLKAWNGAGENDPTPIWTDPRAEPYGPLPNVRFRGAYLNGDDLMLAWVVNGTEVLETPAFAAHNGSGEFVRRLRIGPTDGEIVILVANGSLSSRTEGNPNEGAGSAESLPASRPLDASGTPRSAPLEFSAIFEGRSGYCTLGGEIEGVSLFERNGAIYARVAPCAAQRTVALGLKTARPVSPAPQVSGSGGWTAALAAPDFNAFLKGGSVVRDRPTVAGSGSVSTSPDAYAVDTIELPNPNPWNDPMFIGGFDFFPDGQAAVCTFAGNVFVVSGLDAKLDHVGWRRFASGLNQPLGLKIVKGEIYVACRDGITLLKDLNGGGKADFYERFNNDLELTGNPHEEVRDLQTDDDGNFYFTKGGPVTGDGHGFDEIVSQHGTLLRLSPDGRELKVFATGFRAPNGIGVGPEGELTSGDTMDTDEPASRLNWIQQGGFYGVPELSHWNPAPAESEEPLCWLPKEVDDSPGGQVWVPPDIRWGPWEGGLLHTSEGKSALFGVLREEVADQSKPACCIQQMQGGVVQFPLQFESGIMRARFNPADGQLYVAGFRSGPTTARADACFARVRYTGGALRMPRELHVKKTGLELRFSCSLDIPSASNPASWTVKAWNYPRPHLPKAGSRDRSVEGRERLTIDAVGTKVDDHTVFLSIPGLHPVMQMSIEYKIKSFDGIDFQGVVFNTIHALGE